MPKFYIATSLSRHKEHNLVRDALTREGLQITYDWSLHGSVKNISLERLSHVSQLEMNGIKQADILIILLPGGLGTHTELGIALGLNKPILIQCETPHPFDLGTQTIAFYHHPHIKKIVCPLTNLETLVTEVMNFLNKQSKKPVNVSNLREPLTRPVT